MKRICVRKINIIENGRNEWEMTDEYNDKVRKIVEEITARYSLQLLNEKNWIRRLVIKIRLELEISKRISELSSSRNLHAMASPISL